MALRVGTRRPKGIGMRCFFALKGQSEAAPSKILPLAKKIPADRPCESAGKFFFWLLFFERKEK